MTNLEDVECPLRDRLDALRPAPRAELFRVLVPPDSDRARRVGDFWVEAGTRTFGELLIDCEEPRHPSRRPGSSARGSVSFRERVGRAQRAGQPIRAIGGTADEGYPVPVQG